MESPAAPCFCGLVCNALGPLRYAGAWLAFTLAGATGHLLAGGGQAAGASGVLCGFVGLVVAGRLGGTVTLLDAAVRVPVVWLALALVAKDIVLAFLPGMGVAVGGHLGGYLAGVLAGLLLRRRRGNRVGRKFQCSVFSIQNGSSGAHTPGSKLNSEH